MYNVKDIGFECLNQCQCIKMIVMEQLSLTLLHHVLLLGAQSQF